MDQRPCKLALEDGTVYTGEWLEDNRQGQGTCVYPDGGKYEGEWMNWHKLTTNQANEIIELNTKKKKAISLEEYAEDLIEDTKNDFENVVGQDSLTRFDSPKRKKKRRNNRNRNKNRRKPQNNAK